MSAIFYHNDTQKQLAEDSLKVAQQKIARPIQTKVMQATQFYEAEE